CLHALAFLPPGRACASVLPLLYRAMKNQSIFLIAASLLAFASCLPATSTGAGTSYETQPHEDHQVARLLNIVNSQGGKTADNIKSVLVHISARGRTSKVEVAPVTPGCDLRAFTAKVRQAQLGSGATPGKE